MQIPRQKNNVFGIFHHPKKHPDGNDKNKQHSDLAGPQKHKRFAKTVGIHKILPKHDTTIRRIDIIDNKLFAKKQKIRMGTRSSIGIGKIEKTFCHYQTINNARHKKTNKIANRCFRQNNKNNGFSARETFKLLFQKIEPR